MLFDCEKCRKKPNETIDLMFAGNIGIAQSVETIIFAANKTKEISNLYWHIVGDGSELENIKALSYSLNLDNVIFHGRQELEDMPEYYALADAMLVTMKKDNIVTAMTLPGKVQTYMAAGKPILGAVDGETAEIITEARCGLCCPAEDVDGLVNLVISFIEKDSKVWYAENALNYYSKNFSKASVLQKISTFLR